MRVKRKSILLIIFTGVSLGVLGMVYAINAIHSGFQTTSSEVEIDAHGVCKNVRQTSSQSYFVPTRSSTEWGLFQQYTPSDVYMGNCSSLSECYLLNRWNSFYVGSNDSISPKRLLAVGLAANTGVAPPSGCYLNSGGYRKCMAGTISPSFQDIQYDMISPMDQGAYGYSYASYDKGCGIRSSDKGISCWGTVIGSGVVNAILSNIPSGQFKYLKTTESYGCGIRTNNTVSCWGNFMVSGSDAGIVPSPSGQFESLHAIGGGYCAFGSSTTQCFGSLAGTDYEQLTGNILGIFSTPSSSFSLATSHYDFHTCGLKSNGTVQCSDSSLDNLAPTGLYPDTYIMTAENSDYNGSVSACMVRNNLTFDCGNSTIGLMGTQYNFPAGYNIIPESIFVVRPAFTKDGVAKDIFAFSNSPFIYCAQESDNHSTICWRRDTLEIYDHEPFFSLSDSMCDANPIPDGSACGSSNQGKSFGGYCYYQGNMGQSCTQVCASRGGTNASGDTFINSSNSRCGMIADVFGNTSAYDPTGPIAGYGAQCGCSYWGVVSLGVSSTPPMNYGQVWNHTGVNSSCSFHEYSRFCACNS